jgi:hypothetical protein
MIDQSIFKSFVPTPSAFGGLKIFIGAGDGHGTGQIAGYTVLGNNTVAVPADYVNLAPASTTYVYLDFATASIRTNTTGFVPATMFPIAKVRTDSHTIVDLQDARPDIMAPGAGGGGGGSVPDVTQAFVASGNIALAANQNLFGTVIAAASLLQLPSPAGLAGQSIKLVKIDSTGLSTIAGGSAGNYSLSNRGQFVVFETDGASWFIMGAN